MSLLTPPTKEEALVRYKLGVKDLLAKLLRRNASDYEQLLQMTFAGDNFTAQEAFDFLGAEFSQQLLAMQQGHVTYVNAIAPGTLGELPAELSVREDGTILVALPDPPEPDPEP